MRPSPVRPALAPFLLAGLALAALAPAAAGCPFCPGGPSGVNEVRREVFGPDFWPNVLAAAAPFAVLLAVAAGVHLGPAPPPPRGRR